MIVEAVEPKSGKTMRMECAASSENELRDLLSFEISDDLLKKKINSMAISADAKSVLFTIAKVSVRVGSTVVKIGRKILDVIATVLSDFPMASTGVVFGAIFGFLVGSIPVLGLVLGPFVGAIAVAFGFAMGAIQDFGNKALEQRIKASVAPFETLGPAA